MTATNHTLTGAVIGALIPIPILAIPVAFLSHFVLDALPHFDDNSGHTNKMFLYYLAADCGFAASILLSLMILQPENWALMVACGIASASPDLMWFPMWLKEISGKKPNPMGPVRRFHSKIQWAANKRGILLEIPWFFSMMIALFALMV